MSPESLFAGIHVEFGSLLDFFTTFAPWPTRFQESIKAAAGESP
jgi:hypothetical protein